MMLTATQIRKARATLGWTQSDLANAPGLSLEAVLIAEGIGPRVVPIITTMAIVKAMRSAGIEVELPNAIRSASRDDPERDC